MPSEYYNRNFRPQNFYHIVNRGAYKKRVFLDKNDYEVFLDILSYYLLHPRTKYYSYQKLVNKFEVTNLEETVHLVAYCLMPNHFHLLLKQLPNATDKTNISNLMRRLMITYAMYFQNKYKHEGAIFQGRYKNVTVETDDQLIYTSKYIHLNPVELIKDLGKYPYSSYPAYTNQIKLPEWLHPEYVLKLQKQYEEYVETPSTEKERDKFEVTNLE